MFEHDVIVIGGGLAGLRAALEAQKTRDVALVSKVHPIRSHSCAAQGGINAALSATDSVSAHAFDTVKGSDYLADQDAVEILCSEAPDRIRELDQFGVLFSRNEDGAIAQRPFGGAGFPRTCYAADRTGHHLLHALFEQSVKTGLTVYDEWFVSRLVTEHSGVVGFIAYHVPTGELAGFRAKAVILATGGYGRIYRKSTNAIINTGDGAALALKAGARLEDMEFVQFHPTTLLGSNILITEGARGEGGTLVNKDGDRFMAKYAKGSMELAPRDIVARAIQTELDKGFGVDGDHVDLVLTHLGEDRIKNRLPGIRQIAIDFAGIDPITDPIPVEPGQHYSMGGIAVGNDCRTSLGGLLSVGEASCLSIHGANRLGGNSLLETLVFGKIAGASAAHLAKSEDRLPDSVEAARKEEESRLSKLGRRGPESVAQIRTELKEVMTRTFQLFRNESDMLTGSNQIRDLQERAKRVGVSDSSHDFNYALTGFLELENMLLVAQTVAAGAIARRESRGSHFRTDYASRDDARFLKHSVFELREGRVEITYRPVRLGIFPVKERTY